VLVRARRRGLSFEVAVVVEPLADTRCEGSGVGVFQQGQVVKLRSRAGPEMLWAYRYRVGGRGSKRVQRGGFASEEDARAALVRALEKLRREHGIARTLTLSELVDEYLAQHEASPVTLEKLRFLLTRALAAFGDYRLDELHPHEIAAWRMTIPPGYRFEATQALCPFCVCRSSSIRATAPGRRACGKMLFTGGNTATVLACWSRFHAPPFCHVCRGWQTLGCVNAPRRTPP